MLLNETTATVPAEPTAGGDDDLLALALAELGDRAQRFAVVDESSAAWVVDKLVSYDERKARLKAQFETLLEEIDRAKARFEGRFLPELQDWFDAQDKKGKKSIKLLTGTISARTVPGGFRLVDKAAALEWAREHAPLLVTVQKVETLDTDGLKARAEAEARSTGEVLPGVEYVSERESFSVKAPAAAKAGV